MLIRDRNQGTLRLEWRSPQELAENPANWRRHPESQISALTGVIAEVGWAGACLYNEATGRLIDGHARKKVALEQGCDKVPVLVGSWSQEEEIKILATLDPLAAMAAADTDKLDALLRSVQTDNEAVRKMLDELGKDEGCPSAMPTELIEDEVPPIPVEATTKYGDLYLLGDHRLLCGDATRHDDMRRVLDGAKATCIFTDPPYGVSVGAKNRMLNTFQPSGRCLDNIASDDLSPEDLEQMLLPAFINIRNIAMAEDCTLFTCSPQGGGLGMMMMMMMQNAGLRARHVLIWYKNAPTFSMGRLDYDYQHEPILLTWLKRHKRPMAGEHRTSVWKIDKPRASPEHPTMKPVALYANAYLNNSEKDDIVFDAYSGSGTMFIAADQLNRKAIGLEIEPLYCDVIVKRWENLTGKKATLVPAAELVA